MTSLTSSTVRVKFSIHNLGSQYPCHARIYVNDIAVGTISTADDSSVYEEFSEDITVVQGDKVQLYVETQDVTGLKIYYKNFRVYCTENISTLDEFTINSDTL